MRATSTFSGELYLVIESVRPDTNHLRDFMILLMLTAQEGHN
jgi:hypothetical protein